MGLVVFVYDQEYDMLLAVLSFTDDVDGHDALYFPYSAFPCVAGGKSGRRKMG